MVKLRARVSRVIAPDARDRLELRGDAREHQDRQDMRTTLKVAAFNRRHEKPIIIFEPRALVFSS